MKNNWDLWEEGADGFDYCESLYQLAKHFKCKKGLEIGVRFGKSALPFLLANEDAELVGVDPNPEFEIVDFMVKQGVGDRFWFIEDYSPQAVVANLSQMTFDWVYIDGEHTEEAAMKDFEATWPLLQKGGVMVFDDYRKDQGYDTTVQEAVDKILKRLNKTYVTTETFGLHPNPHGCAIIVK